MLFGFFIRRGTVCCAPGLGDTDLKNTIQLIAIPAILLASLLFLFQACSNKASPAQSTADFTNQPARGETKPGWQLRWEKTIAEGRKEGRVIVQIVAPSPATSQFISRTFKEKFGIDVELSGLPSSVIQEKIERERKAGIFNQDVVLTSMGTSFLFYERIEFPDVLDNVIFLPDVADGKLWMDGTPFLDKNHYAAGGFAGVNTLLFYNSQLARPGEIKSLDDLLDPKWKGKILINDPTITGTGNAALRTIMMFKGEDYLKKLVDQNPTIIRDARLQTEWLAQGKYAVGIGPSFGIIKDFTAAGAPISYILPTEGAFLSNSPGVTMLARNATHPNASTVFINWVLSKEAQVEFARAQDTASRRLDTTAEYLALERRPRLDVRYIKDNDEAFLSKNEELTARIKEIFKPVMQ